MCVCVFGAIKRDMCVCEWRQGMPRPHVFDYTATICECVCVEAQVETCIKFGKIKFKFD